MNKKLIRVTAFATALAITASAMSLSVYAAPAKYSAVEQGYITPVKNQGNWGICWAFSSTAISEASLIKKFPDKYTASTLDLSENLLAYMISHPSLYGKLNSSGDYAKYTASSDTAYLTAGGNVWNAGLALMNGIGPYYENSQYPYSSYGTPGIVNKSFTESEYYELRDSGVAKLTGLYVANINQNNSNDQLKELILEYGAASLSYCDAGSYGKFGSDGSSYYYYCPETYSSNHAVTVVGWDDSIPASAFKTAPAGDGAWLIKNSWGEDSRDNGYFWLSYYDKSIMSDGVAYDYTVDGADDYYDTLYSYDGGNSASSFGYSFSSMYGANVFTAESDSKITGAATYTAKGTDIELSVYTGLKDKTNPTSGTKAATATAKNVAYDGYYSLQFTTPANVQKGDTFAIVAKITNSNGSARVYTEYGYSMNGLTYTLNANKGESYFTYNPDLFWNDCKDNDVNNMMIKAYAVNAECAEHTYGDWITDTAATCTTDGAKHRVCKKCGAVENGVIEKLDHNYSAEWTIDKPADCKDSGEKSRHCKRCDARIDIIGIPSTGEHAYGEWQTVRAATYTATGTKTRTCSMCGKVETSTIAKLTLAAVGGFKVKTKDSTSITLQWNKNANANGYIIETYNGKAWSQVAKITSNSTLTYKVSKLSASKTYQYRIKAYKTEGKATAYSANSATLSVNTNPSGMSGYKVKSKTSTSVTLQWNKNTSATGYELQKWDGKKWVALTKITKNTTTTYTVKSLKASTTYKYRIRAYKTIGKATQYSGYKELSVNTNPSNMSGFKAKSKSYNSITLQWNKNTSATGYELQKWDGKKWVALTKIAKNSTTTYTVKSLKASSTYKYRIRAYKTIGKATQYSGYKELSVNTNPSNMSGFKAKSTAKTSVTLQWKKNTSATGYEIQKWNGKKWVSAAKVTRNSTVTSTVKNLKKNTSYKFRIRAYKTIGKATQYSSWSGTLTVKTKK